MITKEIIGKMAKVVESSNPFNKGINGIIIDETKNTITLKTKKKAQNQDSGTQNWEIKKMIKKQNTFEIENKGQTFLIEGKLLEKRPEERISIK